MKKIIICMLLLLPLIIIASVMLAIDIISVEAYIPVEKVVLNHSYVQLNLSDQYFDGLVATVYPTSAKNKNVEWTITDVVKTVADYEGDAARIDENGKVEFFTYATFKVIATASGKSASCTFYIKGDRVEDVEIVSPKKELATGEKLMLEAVFRPIDAIVGSLVWTSQDENILRVDNNGIVTGVSEGSSVVSVSVEDTEISDSVEITVTKGVTPYGQRFYASDGFDIGGFDLIDEIDGGYIEDKKLYFNPLSDTAVLTIGGKEVVVKKCQKNDITIENMEFFQDFQLRVGKTPLTLRAIYLEAARTDTPNVEWTSSNPKIAEIKSKGQVKAIESGRVTFTATDTDTGKSASIDIEVVRPVSLIVLDMPEKARGIAQKRVFGNLNYTSDGYERAYIDVNFSIPQNADKSDFEYEVLNSHKAYFVGNRLILEDIKGKEQIVIKVSAKIRPYQSVEVYTTYTLEVAEGVNVYDYQGLKFVAQSGKAIFLQDDIVFDKNAQSIVLKNSLYGNGFTISLREYVENNKVEQNTNLIRVGESGVVISNVRMTMDDPSRISMANGLRGHVLRIGEESQRHRFKDIRVEYSIFENGHSAIDIHHSDVEIEGCIIRNASNFGIIIPSFRVDENLEDYSNVVMKNNIMSNMVGPAIAVITSSPDMKRESSLNIKGFLDIYNWQDVLSARMIDRELLEDNETLNNIFKFIIKTGLRNALKNPMFNELKYPAVMDGVDIDFIHLGVVAIGAVHETNAEIIIEDENYIYFELKLVELIKELTGLSLDAFNIHDMYLYCYNNESSITPHSDFIENAELYKRLRGEK
ncbi:MAG: Ig-like domain-containing protein [Bacillota bacterium]|jgi:uncharacterized protein YjdB|nr:Ig-like domain-containing protein [Bacillota bacterium]HHU43290.1 hypothetical protein [Clostridiales bacterium]